MPYLIFALAFFLFGTETAEAQRKRFTVGDYPLASVSESAQDREEEYQKCLEALLGGISLVEDPTTPKSNKNDPEVFTVGNYEEAMQALAAYAQSVCAEDKADEAKKIGKLLKSGKWAAASSAIQAAGAKASKENERSFFIWKDYLEELPLDVPWLQKDYLESSRKYRAFLKYVSKRYERPYGLQAEMGAILADAAQALSNSLENPEKITWRGETEASLEEDDQLRRLAAVVAYFEWRLYEPANGRRSANIDRKAVRLCRQALYDMLHTIVKEPEHWFGDSRHGETLQKLYNMVYAQGWKVDGLKAKKKQEEEN